MFVTKVVSGGSGLRTLAEEACSVRDVDGVVVSDTEFGRTTVWLAPGVRSLGASAAEQVLGAMVDAYACFEPQDESRFYPDEDFVPVGVNGRDIRAAGLVVPGRNPDVDQTPVITRAVMSHLFGFHGGQVSSPLAAISTPQGDGLYIERASGGHITDEIFADRAVCHQRITQMYSRMVQLCREGEIPTLPQYVVPGTSLDAYLNAALQLVEAYYRTFTRNPQIVSRLLPKKGRLLPDLNVTNFIWDRREGSRRLINIDPVLSCPVPLDVLPQFIEDDSSVIPRPISLGPVLTAR